MGLAQSAEVDPDDLDLQIDIELDDEAVRPEYFTPGRGTFTIFAPRDIKLVVDEWAYVYTGLSFRLPFMLVIVVESLSSSLGVKRMIIDCEDQLPLVLRVFPSDIDGLLYNPDPEDENAFLVKRGQPLASAMVLPIARPGFRFYQSQLERV